MHCILVYQNNSSSMKKPKKKKHTMIAINKNMGSFIAFPFCKTQQ